MEVRYKMKTEAATSKISVAMAAKLMHVSSQFVRVGLQCGKLPFGNAIQISGGRYTYYISPKKFTEYTGINLERSDKHEQKENGTCS